MARAAVRHNAGGNLNGGVIALGCDGKALVYSPRKKPSSLGGGDSPPRAIPSVEIPTWLEPRAS